MGIIRKSVVGALALLVLVSCGSDDQPETLTDELVDTLRGVLAQRRDLRRGKTQPQAADQLTRAQVDQSNIPLIRLTAVNTKTKATAGGLQRNGDTMTYLMASDAGIYMRGGLMVGTRGTGTDLMSVDMPYRSVAAIANAGDYKRIHRYLNAENRLVKVPFNCFTKMDGSETITQAGRSYTTRQVVETCQGPDVWFQNRYEMDARGQVWQSRQWISPTSGYFVIEQLKQ